MRSFWYLCPRGHHEVRGEAFFPDGMATDTIICRAVLSDGTPCPELAEPVAPPATLDLGQFRDRVLKYISEHYRDAVAKEIVEAIVQEHGPLTANLAFTEDSLAAVKYWNPTVPLTEEGARRAANLIVAIVYEKPSTRS
jgi:hypothetical protein